MEERVRDALLAGRYEAFDAHTTANCCHGMALFVKRAIEKQEIDTLSELYLCAYATRIDGDRMITYPKKLLEILDLTPTMAKKVIAKVQKKLANQVAHMYKDLACTKMMHGIPTDLFAKYIILKEDAHEMFYAPSLYSMQILLSHLILTRACIAIKSEGETLFYQGDGESSFVACDSVESAITFEGIGKGDIGAFRPESLILACDLYYPMYPIPYERIVPEEKELVCVLDTHAKIQGVRKEDPSLFCLTHISLQGYTARILT